MQDPELDILIKELETVRDMSIADFDGVVHALRFLLPNSAVVKTLTAEQAGTTDYAMLVADELSHGAHCVRTQVGAVGTHIGDITRLIQPLRHCHGFLDGE